MADHNHRKRRRVALEVSPVPLDDKDVVDQLLELYLHDLSKFTGANVGSRGRYGYRYLDDYWTDADRHPFLIRVDNHLAGLAFVRSGSPHDMAEFFVMRKYRRHGIGHDAAQVLFGMFPGEWQIRQLAANTSATKFWRAVIPVAFRQDTIEMGPVQRFRIEPSESPELRRSR
jgi:predicted acetyltransferase